MSDTDIVPLGTEYIYAQEAGTQAHCCAKTAEAMLLRARNVPDGEGAMEAIEAALEEGHQWVDEAVKHAGIAAAWASCSQDRYAHLARAAAEQAARSAVEALRTASALNDYRKYCTE